MFYTVRPEHVIVAIATLQRIQNAFKKALIVHAKGDFIELESQYILGLQKLTCLDSGFWYSSFLDISVFDGSP